MKIILATIICFCVLSAFSQQQYLGFTAEAAYVNTLNSGDIQVRKHSQGLFTHAFGPDYLAFFGRKGTHGFKTGLHYLSTKTSSEIERFLLPTSPLSSFIPSEKVNQTTTYHYLSLPIQYINQNKRSHITAGYSINHFLHGNSMVEGEEKQRLFLSGNEMLAFGLHGAIGLDFTVFDSLQFSPELSARLLFPSNGLHLFHAGIGLSFRTAME